MNTITSLINEDGVRVSGQNAIYGLIDCSLKQIFKVAEDCPVSPDIGTVLQELDLPCLSPAQRCSLDNSFSDSEIR